MNYELLFLNILLNKDNYLSYKDSIDISSLKETHREISYLYVTLASLHEKHEGNISLGDLQVAATAAVTTTSMRLKRSKTRLLVTR